MKLIVLLFATFFAYIDANYCDSKLCSTDIKHIGCNNNDSFASTCVKPKLITMTTALKTLIINYHNTYRNDIAGGKYKPFKKAAKMAEVRWSSELSKLASLNCKRCTFKHDSCHNTNEYRRSGQNLAIVSSTSEKSISTKIEQHIRDSMKRWFIEYKECPIEIIKEFGPTDSTVGHFTIMVNERVIRVGCAVCLFKKGTYYNLYFVCNYSDNNIMGRSVYTQGNSCSKCKGKCSKRYNNLCDME